MHDPSGPSAGVVSVCDEAHLLAALSGGGNVTFTCSGMITLTATIIIAATTGWYSIIWKTEKAWAGTCRALVLQLVDGTEHLAYFQFR